MDKKIKINKQKLILISVILVLLVVIITIIVKTVSDRKSEQVYAQQDKIQNLYENSEENDILLVNVEENVVLDNQVIENEVVEIKTEEPKTSNTGKTKYKLEVNCEQNVVNVYTKDANGEYTNCVKAMLCSVGPATPTSGTYSLKKYGGWEWKGLFGDVFGQYATQITGNILFHSVPYTEKGNKASLEYWEYDKLGTPASMGCVRLTVKNAKWIYDNCMAGTPVTFYEDSNPGPLGKPTEQKISSETCYNNWDPTDPDPNNPWRNYGEEEEPQEEPQNNQEESNIEEVENIENSENTENIENSENVENIENSEDAENIQENNEIEENVQANEESNNL